MPGESAWIQVDRKVVGEDVGDGVGDGAGVGSNGAGAAVLVVSE